MLPSIYEYTDYKNYVRDAISSYPEGGRGLRKEIAHALKCQLPFVSHVLNGEYHFSAEQGFDLARFFELSEAETEQLLKLILRTRSSHGAFSNFLEKQMSRARAQAGNLKESVRIERELSPAHQAVYYSHWSYPAIHMLLTLPGFGRRDLVAERLRLSLTQTNKAIDFLVEVGIVSQNKGSLRTESTQLFLSKNSPLLPQYHRNMRSLAAEACFSDHPEDLHYSSMVTCEQGDVLKIRKILEKSLKEIVEKVKNSREETLCVFNIDWFSFKD